MPWLQISCEALRDQAEGVEDALLDAGALSVTLADAGDNPVLEPGPGETPLWPKLTLTALFEADIDPLPVLARLAGLPSGPRPASIRVERLEDRAWEREWLSRFRPMRFGRRLWICPGGGAAPDRDAVVVRLDPGLAFGTGTHPTTRLCLEWLDAAWIDGRQVVDYGCGSGILSIAAARLGASRVIAIDNDPQAVIATRDNAAANEVTHVVEAMAPAPDVPAADVLLANILAGPLIEFAPTFAGIVRPGGRLVLSGILATQGPAVAAAYRPWFDLDEPVEQEGWLRYDGSRRPEES
jgi:ribosomal protein L11 methyltransferase